ncbi:MAG: pseudouridine synthase [Candidatus Nanopelagicales bacterium]
MSDGPSRNGPAKDGAEPPQQVRLQKVLAQAGVGSRRASELLISDGRVSVDGVDVTTLGTRVDPERAVIRVDGERIPTAAGRAYLALNKPAGMLTAMSDDRGRACVGDLVARRRDRLFHVGRLDAETEGLLLLTNDGDVAHRLSHPSFGVHKVYLAEVSGPVSKQVTQRLRKPIELEDGPVVVDRFRVVGTSGRKSQVEVTLHEGRNHIVRRLLAAVDLPVQRLVRLAYGPVRLGQLGPGVTRPLTSQEIGKLLDVVATQHR